MPTAPREFGPEKSDETQRVLDRLFGDMLFNPRGEIAEEIFKAVGVMRQSQKIGDLTDEEITTKRKEAAQILGDKKSLRYNRKLAEEIADNYRG